MMRQITFTQYEVGIKHMVERPDGLFELQTVPVATIEATSISKADIRKAIIDAGVECKRGTDVYSKPLAKVRYKFESADLMGIVKEREELPLS